MPHDLRKTRKKRGSRTVGWGRVGQHRRRGGKPYRNPGRHKALWSYVIKYDPDYYSKTGFTSPKSFRLRHRVNIINVGALDGLAEKFAVEQAKGKMLVDLENLGYSKLLGSGKITKPLVVRVPSFSESAAEKVKEAGGEILSPPEKEEETEQEQTEEAKE
ncbi:MAG TPA: uL15 family ribosomal protein [Candidatus Bathyarchaeia archaeon]|nr:50S ribosomal protein L15, large subunit ribosomal protein L15 [uncultured archaeon]HJW98029.1 uL15 family ribosomal protein [Candidatus Bathyarchaeia archaeon]